MEKRLFGTDGLRGKVNVFPMTPLQIVSSVVLPQAFRRALPGCGNEIIYLIKYSSLASIITVNDLTGMAAWTTVSPAARRHKGPAPATSL